MFSWFSFFFSYDLKYEWILDIGAVYHTTKYKIAYCSFFLELNIIIILLVSFQKQTFVQH